MPTRRDFVKSLGAAGLAAIAAPSPRIFAAEKAEKLKPRADAMIFLFMSGGMASTETFDPKHYEPFSSGVDARKVLSTFPTINTSADHIKISAGLENTAKVMDKCCLIRTMQGANLGKILHSRHQFHLHTGYVPPVSVPAPHIGAWIARTLGPRNPDVPAFIDIAEPLQAGESEVVKAYLTSGFLGNEYGPFRVPFPATAAKDIKAKMSDERLTSRVARYREMLKASPVGDLGSSYQQESLVKSMENAYRLLRSPAAKAIDLSLESKEAYANYNTSDFGLGCLMARRLVEAGARFIEVHVNYVPFGHFDTHDNGHTKLVQQKQEMDRPIAQLITDLEARGLLDRTMVVLATEFSRDPLVEGKPDALVEKQAATPKQMTEMKLYGMHAHFTSAGSVAIWGGGFKKGHIHGVTADEHPCTTIKDPVTIEDLHATLYTAMGISPKHNYEFEQRPFYTTKDGKGKAITSLFA
jgi:uncharacterized protein (DUF1501 family)